VTEIFWGVVREPEGESDSHPQPLEGVDAVKVVAFVADTLSVCEFPLVAPNVSDDVLSVRPPVPPPPVPPLTTTTTGTVTLLFEAPLAFTTMDPVLTPFARDEGFRWMLKLAGVTVLPPLTVIQLADGVTVIESAELSLAVAVNVESLQPPPDWKLHVTVPYRPLTVAFTTAPE
jgi:hypothetical protein